MARTTFSGPVASDNGFIGDITGDVTGVVTAAVGSKVGAAKIVGMLTTTATITDGAGAGTITLPANAKVLGIYIETPTTIPGTPDSISLRLGSAANGQQYVADVDVKAQGWVVATVLYAGRNPATTVHWTVAGSGGTAASQDGSVLIHIQYAAA